MEGGGALLLRCRRRFDATCSDMYAGRVQEGRSPNMYVEPAGLCLPSVPPLAVYRSNWQGAKGHEQRKQERAKSHK